MSQSYATMKDFCALYQKEGAYHHRALGFKRWWLEDNYRAIAAECRAQDRVLDLACGEGCLSGYLQPALLVGVDYSADALELARQLYGGAYHQLLLGDMRHLEKLPLDRPGFDVVTCSLSLMYLLAEDLRHCLQQVHRFLVPGGLFVCTYPTVGPHRTGSAEACELPPHELQAELELAGFAVEKLQPFCPLVDATMVKDSEAPQTAAAARRAYEQAKQHMTLETSYHFLCRARRVGS